jgi:hypothetical protein
MLSKVENSGLVCRAIDGAADKTFDFYHMELIGGGIGDELAAQLDERLLDIEQFEQ